MNVCSVVNKIMEKCDKQFDRVYKMVLIRSEVRRTSKEIISSKGSN